MGRSSAITRSTIAKLPGSFGVQISMSLTPGTRAGSATLPFLLKTLEVFFHPSLSSRARSLGVASSETSSSSRIHADNSYVGHGLHAYSTSGWWRILFVRCVTLGGAMMPTSFLPVCSKRSAAAAIRYVSGVHTTHGLNAQGLDAARHSSLGAARTG